MATPDFIIFRGGVFAYLTRSPSNGGGKVVGGNFHEGVARGMLSGRAAGLLSGGACRRSPVAVAGGGVVVARRRAVMSSGRCCRPLRRCPPPHIVRNVPVTRTGARTGRRVMYTATYLRYVLAPTLTLWQFFHFARGLCAENNFSIPWRFKYQRYR